EETNESLGVRKRFLVDYRPEEALPGVLHEVEGIEGRAQPLVEPAANDDLHGFAILSHQLGCGLLATAASAGEEALQVTDGTVQLRTLRLRHGKGTYFLDRIHPVTAWLRRKLDSTLLK